MADLADLPNLVRGVFDRPDPDRLMAPPLAHKPRILLLYGSLRERSYSRFLTLEAQRLLEAVGLHEQLPARRQRQVQRDHRRR